MSWFALGDSLYQVLLKYDFDLFRGAHGITEYLRSHCQQYYKDVLEAVNGDNSFLGEEFVKLLRENLSLLNDICTEIPNILELYDQGFLGNAYQQAYALFERLKPYYIVRFDFGNNAGCLYRIREGDFRIHTETVSKKQKMELFHIKKEMRNKIGAYRYSV